MKQYIIKVSGKVLHDETLFEQLLKDIHQLILQGNACILIHGGGLTLTEYCKKNNISSHFDDQGRRITSKEEMLASDMILLGKINTSIVRMCINLDIRAIGLSCVDHSILIGNAVGDTYTGIPHKTDTTLLTLLCNQHILPVLCSVSTTNQGKPLNINADDVALHIGISWKTNHLIFITDTPGINIENNYVTTITSSDINHYIDRDIIQDGMVVKTKNAIHALRQGVSSVFIGSFNQKGDLKKLITNETGTKIIIC